jgi:hypothetical protein
LGLIAWLGAANPYATKCGGAISELGDFVQKLSKDSKVSFCSDHPTAARTKVPNP